jgi:hypothetical protein
MGGCGFWQLVRRNRSERAMTFSCSGLSCDFGEVSPYEDYKWPKRYEMEFLRLLLAKTISQKNFV